MMSESLSPLLLVCCLCFHFFVSAAGEESGMDLFWAREYNAAASALRTELPSLSSDPISYYALAVSLAHTGEFDEGSSVIEAGLGKFGEALFLSCARAILLDHKGDYVAGEEAMSACVESSKLASASTINPSVIVDLFIRVFMDLPESSSLVPTVLSACTDLADDITHTLKISPYAYYAGVLVDAGQHNASVDVARRGVVHAARTPEGQRMLSGAYVPLTADEEAVASHLGVLTTMYAGELFNNALYKEAATHYQSAYALAPAATTASNWAITLYQSDPVANSERALEIFRTCEQDFPGAILCKKKKSFVLRSEKRYLEAAQALADVLTASPPTLQADQGTWEAFALTAGAAGKLPSQSAGDESDPVTRVFFGHGISNPDVLARLHLKPLEEGSCSGDEKRKLVLYCANPAKEKAWGPDSVANGIPGSEEAVIFLSREFAHAGYDVTVYNHFDQDQPSVTDGVTWRPLSDWDASDASYQASIDVFVCWRWYEACFVGWAAHTRVLWLQDAFNPLRYTSHADEFFHRVIVLCKNEYRKLPENVKSKAIISMNAMNPDFYVDGPNHRHRFIYSSSPDRGLDVLLRRWSEIRAELLPNVAPNAPELHVFYGFTKFFYVLHANNPDMMAWKDEIEELLKQEGVVYHGMVGHEELARAFAQSGFWVYPTDAPETSCITAMKAQAMGAIPVTSRHSNSALPDTAGKYDLGARAPEDLEETIAKNQQWQDAWVASVISAARLPPETLSQHREEMKEYARNVFTWRNVAEQWHRMFDEVLGFSPVDLPPSDPVVSRVLKCPKANHVGVGPTQSHHPPTERPGLQSNNKADDTNQGVQDLVSSERVEEARREEREDEVGEELREGERETGSVAAWAAENGLPVAVAQALVLVYEAMRQPHPNPYLIEQGLQRVRETLRNYGTCAICWVQLGSLLQHTGHLEEGYEALRRGINLGYESWDVYFNYGIMSGMVGDHPEAIRALEKGLLLVTADELQRDDPPLGYEFYDSLAGEYAALDNLPRAIELQIIALRYLEKSQSLPPRRRAKAYNHLGSYYFFSHLYVDAAEWYGRAMQEFPENSAYLFNYGTSLEHCGRYQEALAVLQECVDRADSHSMTCLVNVGVAYSNSGDHYRSQQTDRKILSLEPNSTLPMLNLVTGLAGSKELLEAQSYIDALTELVDPAMLSHRKKLITMDRKIRREAADWRDWRHSTAALLHFVGDEASGKIGFSYNLEMSFHMLREPDTRPEDVKACALKNAETLYREAAGIPAPPLTPAHPLGSGERLRIGYMSADLYGEHPSGHALQGMFTHHDRSKVEVFCYSRYQAGHDPVADRIRASCDHYFEAAGWTRANLARTIRDHRLHVFGDLSGLTRGSVAEVVTMRMAPVQFHMLSFLGTMGINTMDYIVADRIVIPPERLGDYTERPLLTPYCFLVNDHRSRIEVHPEEESGSEVHRAFPDDVVVFSSFNNGNKVDPVGYSVWLDVVQRVPNSVLWILPRSDNFWRNIVLEAAAVGVLPAESESNLQGNVDAVADSMQAKTREICMRAIPLERAKRYQAGDTTATTVDLESACERSMSTWSPPNGGASRGKLVRFEFVPKSEFLLKASTSDLMLDTQHRTASITALDVLWAQLPSITLPSTDRMIDRVGASAAVAAGVPDLIVSSFKEYADFSVELAESKLYDPRGRGAFWALREKMARVRESQLYDTDTWMQTYEDTLFEIYNEKVSSQNK
eukprot:Rmarinus@m.23949